MLEPPILTMIMLIIHVINMPMAAMWYCHVFISTVPLRFWSVPFTGVGLNMFGRIMKKKLRIIKKFKTDSHSRKYLKMIFHSRKFNSFGKTSILISYSLFLWSSFEDSFPMYIMLNNRRIIHRALDNSQ